MCHIAFIEMAGHPALCEYLLVKFIFACVFGGVVLLHLLCSKDVNGIFVLQLCLMAFVFELVLVCFITFCLAMVCLVVIEMASTVCMCLCVCFISPLLTRARVRGRMSVDQHGSWWTASRSLVIAFKELLVLLFVEEETPDALKNHCVAVVVVSRELVNAT